MESIVGALVAMMATIARAAHPGKAAEGRSTPRAIRRSQETGQLEDTGEQPVDGGDTQRLQYHARTYELLDQAPVRSPENERLLCSIEASLGGALPAALREWYALTDATRILADHSLCDHPIPLQELGRPVKWWLPYQPRDEGVLPFMVENQGVCTWAVRLDGGDDPAVLVEVDSGSPPRWQFCMERFSHWVYWLVRDGITMTRVRYQAQADPLSQNDLAILRAAFSEGERTYAWPGAINYRWHGDLGDLIIWAGHDQADWWLAPAAGMARPMLEHLSACSDLVCWLYATTEEDRLYLDQLRTGRDQG